MCNNININKAKLVEWIDEKINKYEKEGTLDSRNVACALKGVLDKINSGEFDCEVVKSELILTDAEIDSACMSYRHDFGLMSDREKSGLRYAAKEWLRGLNQAKDK